MFSGLSERSAVTFKPWDSKAEAELMASADLELDELQESIEAIASDLMVDIVFNK